MLTITARFLEPVYEAAVDDAPEWPPHPGRLLSALVAAAGDDTGERDAVRVLEDTEPTLHVPEACPSVPRAFVPTNAVGPTRSNRPARTSNERTWPRSTLRRPVVQFSWDIDLAPDQLATLAEVCRRVGYLGRASSQVVLNLDAPVDPALATLVPGGGQHRLRVGFPGYVDALVAAFDANQPAHSVRRSAFYGAPGVPAPPTPTHRPPAYPDLLTRALAPGVRLDGRLVLRLTEAWKKAVLQRLGAEHGPDDLALLHGHHDGSRRQCAFLGLPFVGHRHATGDLLGVGLAVSPDLPRHVRRSVLAVFGLVPGVPALGGLRLAGLGALDLVEPDGRRTVDPERWVGPAEVWASAVPVLPDRYPDDLAEAEAFVADGCELAGYPRPLAVELLPASPVAGAAHLRRADAMRRGSPARPRLHVRLAFAEPVTGPVVVGHLRHLGLGLFVPQPTPASGATP
ncbi:MAG: type I-G CRISPR-associated protein Csb2 [Acidimicrobiales bacterium]